MSANDEIITKEKMDAIVRSKYYIDAKNIINKMLDDAKAYTANQKDNELFEAIRNVDKRRMEKGNNVFNPDMPISKLIEAYVSHYERIAKREQLEEDIKVIKEQISFCNNWIKGSNKGKKSAKLQSDFAISLFNEILCALQSSKTKSD